MNLEEKLTNVVEDGSTLPFAVEDESHHLNVCRNPGRNLPESRHTVASYNIIYPSAVSVLSRNFR